MEIMLVSFTRRAKFLSEQFFHFSHTYKNITSFHAYIHTFSIPFLSHLVLLPQKALSPAADFPSLLYILINLI